MAKSLNRCEFIGNLGGDVESKALPNGNMVANFSIACSDDYKDKQSGQLVEQTDWIRVAAFGRTAEICAEYLRKGSKVWISGKMKTRSFEKDGQTRWVTEIKLEDMLMLDGKPEGGDRQARPQQSQPRAQSQPQPAPDYDSFDDDIPFADPYRGARSLLI